MAVLLVIAGLVVPGVVFGATWYVGVDNALDDVATHGGDAATPFATLTYAESQAADGDTVEIADGTYTEVQLLASKSLTWNGESKAGTIITATERHA